MIPVPTLTKQDIVRAIGKQTGLRDADVAQAIEALISLLTEHLATGERIEIQNFLVMEVQTRSRTFKPDRSDAAPQRIIYRSLKVRPGKHLRAALREQRKDEE